MKKIGLLFNSSHQIGGGHFWRCFNLAKILNNKNREFFFISNKLEKNFVTLLQKKKFNYKKVNSVKKKSKKKTIKIKKKINVIITDYYKFDAIKKKKIKKFVNTLIVIDDYLHKKHNCDVYINNNFMTNIAKNKIKKLNPNSELLLGIKYFIHNQDFLTQRKVNKNKKNIKNIFAFFGSSDPTNETFKFIKSINYFQNINFQILVGRINKNYKKIKNYCKDKKNIKIFYNLSNHKTLKIMQNNELSFGSGGLNLTERLFAGTASVAICTAKNQRDALITLSKKKIIHYLGDSRDVDIPLIKKCIKNFLNNKRLFQSLLKKTYKHYNTKYNSDLLRKRLNLIINKK